MLPALRPLQDFSIPGMRDPRLCGVMALKAAFEALQECLVTQQNPTPADAAAAPFRLRRLPALSPKVIHISDPHSEERRRVEAFVESVYAKAYGGHILRHYPTLMSVQDAGGRIFAVVGFRFADEEDLYLEQYLDGPVEAAISERTGLPAQRSGIVEIGNLASDGRGATVVLFLALAEHLRTRGREFAVATATAELRGIFARAGFPTAELARADRSRLPDGGASWGAYYQQAPIVLAGSISAACPSLESFAASTARPALRSRLHYRGVHPE